MAEEQFLVPQDQYLKAGIHIGTKFRTKYMENFIYKVRPDGLAVLNLKKIDERIKIAAKFLSQYDPEDILVVSRRENGWKAVTAMAKYVGNKFFAGRYLPGILTNPSLERYVEVKVVLVTDSWPDRNVIKDNVRRSEHLHAIQTTGKCSTRPGPNANMTNNNVVCAKIEWRAGIRGYIPQSNTVPRSSLASDGEIGFQYL